MAAIVARRLIKHYGKRTALNGVSLEVADGEIFALLGPNGAGKTTLLEIFEGLRMPDRGQARVLELDPADPLHRPKLRGRIGVSLQVTALFDTLTVRETLELYCALYPRADSPDTLLRRMDLQEEAGVRTGQLSGGLRQRVCLALALANRPFVVFLDEPTTGLDPSARRYVWDSIRTMAKEARTVVLTTHDMDEATRLAQHVAIMDEGRIVAEGTPDDIVEDLGLGVKIHVAPKGLSLEGVSRHGASSVTALPDGWTITAEQAEPLVQWLFDRARATHIPITRLEVERATLEDAFLHLTGRGLE